MTQSALEKKEVTFTKVFSSFSVNNLQKAKEFYAKTLGLNVVEEEEGLGLQFDSGQSVFIYPKTDHAPATFTVLNLMVDDISEAVDGLAVLGVKFESYDGEMKTDEKGIFWGSAGGNGPNIAWLKDPAGNILSVIENK